MDGSAQFLQCLFSLNDCILTNTLMRPVCTAGHAVSKGCLFSPALSLALQPQEILQRWLSAAGGGLLQVQRHLSCSGHEPCAFVKHTSVGNGCKAHCHWSADHVTHGCVTGLYKCFLSLQLYFLPLDFNFSSFQSFLPFLVAYDQAIKERVFFTARICVKT